MAGEASSGTLGHNTPLVPVLVAGGVLGLIATFIGGSETTPNTNNDPNATAAAFVNTLTADMDSTLKGHALPATHYTVEGKTASASFTFTNAELLTLDAMNVDHNDPRNKAIAGCAVAAMVDLHNRLPATVGEAFNAGHFETAEAACHQAASAALEAHQIDHLYGLTGLVTR